MMFTVIDIETTQFCNRRCGYCPNSTHYDVRTKGNPNQMPMPMIANILKQLKEVCFRGRVNLNLYGEPLLDERIVPIASAVASIGAKPAIYTNGDLLDDKVSADLAGTGAIVIVTNHDGAFNYELAEICNRHGFVYRDFTHDIGVLHNRCGLVSHPMAMGKAEVCFPQSKKHMYINANGDALLCCNDYLAELTYGNVVDRWLDDIWYDPAYVEHRKQLPNPNLTICRRCNCT